MQIIDSIKAGLTVERSFEVQEGLTTSRTGTPILSTPRMIGLMEKVCADLVEPLLPPGHITVGFEVNVRHRAPARLGATITVAGRLLEVDGRKLLFEVQVREANKVVGEGTHRRTIVTVSA